MPVSAATCAKIIDMAKSVTNGTKLRFAAERMARRRRGGDADGAQACARTRCAGPKPIAPANPATR